MCGAFSRSCVLAVMVSVSPRQSSNEHILLLKWAREYSPTCDLRGRALSELSYEALFTAALSMSIEHPGPATAKYRTSSLRRNKREAISAGSYCHDFPRRPLGARIFNSGDTLRHPAGRTHLQFRNRFSQGSNHR